MKDSLGCRVFITSYLNLDIDSWYIWDLGST